MIITEYELRAHWHKDKAKVITVPPGSLITPAARDFLVGRGIQVKVEGNGYLDLNKLNYSTVRQSIISIGSGGRREGQTAGKKPEPPQPGPRAKAATEEPGPAELEQKIRELVAEQLRQSRGREVAGPGAAAVKQEEKADTPQAAAGTAENQGKPEHMTNLNRDTLVVKNHPVIKLRGQLDQFECQVLEAELYFKEKHEDELVGQMEEIAAYCRQLMAAEVKNEPFQWERLIGYSADELREVSHHPQKHLGVRHSSLSAGHGPIAARLHNLRAKAREVELAAIDAFTDGKGNCSRIDLIRALNRLSSALYILACKARARYEAGEKSVAIRVEQPQIHLSRAHLEQLFGSGYRLNQRLPIGGDGEYEAEETVTLVGNQGTLEKVRIIGPVREETRVTIPVSGARRLGLRPVKSGEISSAGITVVGPVGKIDLSRGITIGTRELRIGAEQARAWGLDERQEIKVRIGGERPVIYEGVKVKVGQSREAELHLDADEADAALVEETTRAVLLGV